MAVCRARICTTTRLAPPGRVKPSATTLINRRRGQNAPPRVAVARSAACATWFTPRPIAHQHKTGSATSNRARWIARLEPGAPGRCARARAALASASATRSPCKCLCMAGDSAQQCTRVSCVQRSPVLLIAWKRSGTTGRSAPALVALVSRSDGALSLSILHTAGALVRASVRSGSVTQTGVPWTVPYLISARGACALNPAAVVCKSGYASCKRVRRTVASHVRTYGTAAYATRLHARSTVPCRRGGSGTSAARRVAAARRRVRALRLIPPSSVASRVQRSPKRRRAARTLAPRIVP